MIPYAAYDEIPVNLITDENCDVFGRTVVRLLEIIDSIAQIRYALDNLPDGELTAKIPRRIPEGVVFSRTEAPAW